MTYAAAKIDLEATIEEMEELPLMGLTVTTELEARRKEVEDYLESFFLTGEKVTATYPWRGAAGDGNLIYRTAIGTIREVVWISKFEPYFGIDLDSGESSILLAGSVIVKG